MQNDFVNTVIFIDQLRHVYIYNYIKYIPTNGLTVGEIL